MIIEGTSDRLEERLERLAKLHTDGDLDDNEYRSAKALLLAPTDGTTDATDTPVRLRGPLGWGALLILAIIVGFTLACLSSAITTLQGPAGPVLCSNGDFVAGNVSETLRRHHQLQHRLGVRERHWGPPPAVSGEDHRRAVARVHGRDVRDAHADRRHRPPTARDIGQRRAGRPGCPIGLTRRGWSKTVRVVRMMRACNVSVSFPRSNETSPCDFARPSPRRHRSCCRSQSPPFISSAASRWTSS